MDGNLVNLFSNALLSADGRMFGLDAQLLFELCIQGINILILFTFLSYIYSPLCAIIFRVILIILQFTEQEKFHGTVF